MSARPATAPRISIQGSSCGRKQTAEPDDLVDMRTPASISGASRHISAKARLCSLSRPSEPNTATPSLRVSRVSPCTRISALYLGFEIDPLAQIVERVGHAALRIGIGDDAQRAAVGQIPPRLLRLDGAVAREDVRLSRSRKSACSGSLRAARRRSSTSLSVGREARKAPVESPEPLIGGVAEDELLPASNIATAVGSWSSVRTCASICRCRSARTASSSEMSTAMPAAAAGGRTLHHVEDARAGPPTTAATRA